MSQDSTHTPSISINLDPEAIRQLVRTIVQEVLAVTEKDREETKGRLAYSEGEAARMLGLEPWQLRDERLRGRIGASAIVGRRIRYMQKDLLDYLARRRIQASSA